MSVRRCLVAGCSYPDPGRGSLDTHTPALPGSCQALEHGHRGGHRPAAGGRDGDGATTATGAEEKETTVAAPMLPVSGGGNQRLQVQEAASRSKKIAGSQVTSLLAVKYQDAY